MYFIKDGDIYRYIRGASRFSVDEKGNLYTDLSRDISINPSVKCNGASSVSGTAQANTARIHYLIPITASGSSSSSMETLSSVLPGSSSATIGVYQDGSIFDYISGNDVIRPINSHIIDSIVSESKEVVSVQCSADLQTDFPSCHSECGPNLGPHVKANASADIKFSGNAFATQYFFVLRATATCDIKFGGNATIRLRRFFEGAGAADFKFDSEAIVHQYHIYKCIAGGSSSIDGTANATEEVCWNGKASGSSKLEATVKTYFRYPLKVTGSSILSASTKTTDLKAGSSSANFETTGYSDAVLNWEMHGRAHGGSKFDATCQIKILHRYRVTSSVPLKVSATCKAKATYSAKTAGGLTLSIKKCDANTKFKVGSTSAGFVWGKTKAVANYKRKVVGVGSIVFNVERSYGSKVLCNPAKASGLSFLEGNVIASEFHWWRCNTSGGSVLSGSIKATKKIRARCNPTTNSPGSKLSANRCKPYKKCNSRVSAGFVTNGSATPPPFYLVKVRASADFKFDIDTKVKKLYFLYGKGILNRLKWNKMNNIDHYEVWRSDMPGADYYQTGVAPQDNNPHYDVIIDRTPRNLLITSETIGTGVSWDEPEFVGAPMTFKVVPIGMDSLPLLNPQKDQTWMDDGLPSGASWNNQTGLTQSSYRRHGQTSLKISAENGYVEPQFTGATTAISDSNIIVWVYLDRNEIPDTIWLSFFDGTGFEHRIYWGRNNCVFGENGTAARRYGEELPSPGCWTPLVVHTKNLEVGSVTGMGIGVSKYNGVGTIYVDCVYYTSQPVYRLPLPHVGLRPEKVYGIYRNDKLINYTNSTSYRDYSAIDIYGFTSSGGAPLYRLEAIDLENKVRISWGIPNSRGTDYVYKITSFDVNGVESEPINNSVHVVTRFSKVEITISSPNTPEFTVEATGWEYFHENAISGETYHYIFKAYSDEETIIATSHIYYTVPWGSVLDEFVLDQGILA